MLAKKAESAFASFLAETMYQVLTCHVYSVTVSYRSAENVENRAQHAYNVA